tara:strand:+ start:87 stop:755 length:669 start_codon:yes stop_codon:yes gene_type:complete
MPNSKKIYGLIPLRKGSTRIKNKNFIKILKKPLYKYALDQALRSKLINKIFISTDSNKIKSHNKKLSIISRSKLSSTNYAPTELVIEEFLKRYDCDYLVLIQATNPFLKTKYIDQGIMKILKNKKKFNTVLSAVKNEHFIWKKNKKGCIFPKNYNYKKRTRMQDTKLDEFIENGAFYIFSTTGFKKNKNRLYGKISYIEMPKESVFEVDDKEDLKIIKKLLR